MNPDATICLLCKRSGPSPHGTLDDGSPCPNRDMPWPKPVGARCAGCAAPLTDDELNFYGATCERCEGKAFHAQQDADESRASEGQPAKKVTHLGQRRHDLARLVADIKAAVYAHSGQISTVEAIGALELAKHEIIGEQL